MAKRAKSQSGGTESLVSLARKFESLSAEVLTLRSSLQSKEQELATVRRALAAKAGMHASPEDSRSVSPRSRRPSGGGGGGGPREGTLGDFILKLMADGTVRGPSDVLEGVKKAGYSSDAAAKSQAVMVTITLGRLAKTGVLKKQGRAQYVKA